MKILFIALCFFIAGCASQKPLEVDIPIPVAATKVTIPTKPHLPVWDLTDKSTDQEIVKACLLSLDRLNSWGNDCQSKLKAVEN